MNRENNGFFDGFTSFCDYCGTEYEVNSMTKVPDVDGNFFYPLFICNPCLKDINGGANEET